MYEGCEPHWKCIYCGEYMPFHCYSKEQFEQQCCKVKGDTKMGVWKEKNDVQLNLTATECRELIALCELLKNSPESNSLDSAKSKLHVALKVSGYDD
jgi:hypothetical protein